MSPTPLRRLLVAILLVIAALALRARVPEADPFYQRLLQLLPYLTLGAAAALCIFFNRARLLAAALLMLATHVTLPRAAPAAFAPGDTAVYALLSVVLPLSLIVLLFLHERGLRSTRGMFVVAVLPLTLCGAWWLGGRADAATAAWLHQHMAMEAWSGFMLSARAAAVLATALVTGLLLLVWRGTEDVAALVGSLIFVFLALAMFDRDGMTAAMFGTAGLNLGICLLRSSHEMAFRDELTGILGRRALNDRLKGLGRRYTIAMLDVDHFKQFNDTHGHDVGDDVLKMVARHIDGVGGGGTAYRYGGEEFSIVFPGKAVAQCASQLEEVRRAVARYRLILRDSGHRDVPKREARARRGRRRRERDEGAVSVTISIGAAQRDDAHATPEDVIKAADAALYRAKEKGRNCLVY